MNPYASPQSDLKAPCIPRLLTTLWAALTFLYTIMTVTICIAIHIDCLKYPLGLQFLQWVGLVCSSLGTAFLWFALPGIARSSRLSTAHQSTPPRNP